MDRVNELEITFNFSKFKLIMVDSMLFSPRNFVQMIRESSPSTQMNVSRNAIHQHLRAISTGNTREKDRELRRNYLFPRTGKYLVCYIRIRIPPGLTARSCLTSVMWVIFGSLRVL